MQSMFNCDKTQHTGVNQDNLLNSLIYGSPYYIIIYTSYTLKTVRFVWPTLCVYVHPHLVAT